MIKQRQIVFIFILSAILAAFGIIYIQGEKQDEYTTIDREDLYNQINRITVFERQYDSLKTLSKSRPDAALHGIDSLYILEHDTSMLGNYCNMQADIYFEHGDYEKSIDKSTQAISFWPFISPETLARRAASYVQLKRYNLAFVDLKEAVRVNLFFAWNIGNYYEVIGKKDSALYYYNKLYNTDKKALGFVKERADTIANSLGKPLTKLILIPVPTGYYGTPIKR